jgi:hypothetical protein
MVIGMTNETAGQARTAKARSIRMRAAEEKKAAGLTERGWMCFPPDVSAGVKELLQYAADAHHSEAPRSA